MYSGGLVVRKASTIGIDISPTPPLIFTGGQKVWNLASLSTSLNFEPPAFENVARYPNSETKVQCYDDRPMSYPSLVKLGPRPPWECSVSSAPPRKIACENVLNRQSQLRIIQFCSYFAQSLNTWHPKCCKSSRSKVKVTAWDNMQKFTKLSIIQPGLLDFAQISCRLWSHDVWCTTDFQDQQVNGQGCTVT